MHMESLWTDLGAEIKSGHLSDTWFSQTAHVHLSNKDI